MIKYFLILLSAFLCLEYTTLPVLAVTRVALVSTCGERAENNVLALAEVLLSTQPDIALVERREVERALNEQKLILSGLGDSDKAMATGKLLGVEVFAVLEILPGSKEVLGLLVFDAGNGVKLLDMTLPADGGEKTAKIVLTGMRKACAKRQQPALHKKNVCLLSMRNAELPREMDDFCAALGVLLERALLDSPGIAVLERNRLEFVNRERSLPVAEESKDLWSSVVIVESDVRLAADGRDLWVVCHLSNVTGQDIGTVDATSSQTNADLLARELASRFTESLHVVPVGAEVNPLIEASLFSHEAQLLHSHGDRSAAIAHMYATCALAPTNKVFRAELNSFLIDDAYSRLEEARRCFRFADGRRIWRSKQFTKEGSRFLTEGHEQLTKALDEMGPVLVEQHVDDNRWLRDNTNSFKIGSPFNGADRLILQLRRIYDRGDESQQSRIQTIINEYLDHIVDRIEIALLRTGGTGNDNENLISQNTSNILNWLRFIRNWSLNSNDYHRRFAKIATAWLKMSERIYHEESTAQNHKWDLEDNSTVSLLWRECTGIGSVFGPERKKPISMMNEASTKFGDAMIRNPYPLIRLYGHAIELHNALQSDCLSPDIAQQQRIEFKEAALNIMLTKPTWTLYRDTDYLFQKLFTDTNELYDAQVEWCDMLLSSHIVYDDLVRSLINKEADPANKLKWIERVLAVNALADSQSYYNHRALVAVEFEQLHNKVLGIPTPVPMPVVSAEPPPTLPCLPWTEIHRVFDITSIAGLSSFDHFVMDGEAIYVLCHGSSQETLGQYRGIELLKLLKIHLPDGGAQQFGVIKQPYFANVTDVCFGDGHFYVATDGQGIFDFPIGPGEVRVIDSNNGLPSSVVYSIAYLDGRLYAGLGGDGYIISYDLASNRPLVLASSRRREKLSPLDNGPRFQTDHMLADPKRNRVLFRIQGQQEIWRINQDDTICLYAKISKYSPYNPKNYTDQYIKKLVLKDEHGVAICGKDNQALVYNLLNTPYEIMHIREDAYYSGTNSYIYGDSDFAPRLCQVVGKWLWIASPFGRMNMKKNMERELFPGLAREGVGVGFNPTQCIFPFNNGKQLLLGDDKTLWLVDLKID
ncbi:MAG: hypothetical protein NT011_08575 [Kiritimatiellaeota bacterium]|nr:hypothetical protein [Kiritimatiellota bacterium]